MARPRGRYPRAPDSGCSTPGVDRLSPGPRRPEPASFIAFQSAMTCYSDSRQHVAGARPRRSAIYAIDRPSACGTDAPTRRLGDDRSHLSHVVEEKPEVIPAKIRPDERPPRSANTHGSSTLGGPVAGRTAGPIKLPSRAAVSRRRFRRSITSIAHVSRVLVGRAARTTIVEAARQRCLVDSSAVDRCRRSSSHG